MAIEKICGLDEAGRGPLAGPVTAGCVVLGPHFPIHILKDSKALTEKQRERAFPLILEHAVAWGIGWCWPSEIDSLNIHHASLLAMKKAYLEMKYACEKAESDGLFAPDLGIPCTPIVKGDATVPAISAASILAKVARDRWMVRWSWIDDRYGFEKHKGYPTALHREAIARHGLSEIHRKSFRSEKTLFD